MVRKGGLEPPCLSAPPPQDGVSANFTTSALKPKLPATYLWTAFTMRVGANNRPCDVTVPRRVLQCEGFVCCPAPVKPRILGAARLLPKATRAQMA